MGKNFTDSRAFNIVLAILISLALWAYVVTSVNPNADVSLHNFPVTLVGEDVLSGKGLMLDPGTKLTLDLKLTGNRNALAKVLSDTSHISITADVSDIDSTGTYTLPCTITLPNTITSGTVTVEDRAEKTITLGISKMMKKTIAVQGTFIGTVSKNYRTNPFTISPSSIQIQGPEDIVKQVDHALVTISGNNLTKSFSGEESFSLIGTDGKTINDSNIVSDVDTVNVSMPVVMTQEISLDVTFTEGGGATMDDVDYSISPSSIWISGDADAVTPLVGKSLSLGEIDLSAVEDSGTYSFPIVLDSALTNDSGEDEATVTVTIKNLTTKTLDAQNIDIINVPSGFTAAAVTQSLQVRVRGTEAQLDSVSDYQLRVVADLEGKNLSVGQFRFPAKIYLDNDSGAGVVGGDYYIVISIQK